MKNNLFLYMDSNGLVSHASHEIIEIKEHDRFSIPINNDLSVLEIYQLSDIDTKLYGRKFKLDQDENGQYFLRNIFYIYYFDRERIISLNPKQNENFDRDNNIKCRIIIEDENIKKIQNGKKSLSCFTVQEKGKNYAVLEEKVYKSDLWLVKNISRFKLNLSTEEADHVFIYDKKEHLISIKVNANFQTEFFWYFITKKNDPTIVYYTANEIKRSKDGFIHMLNVPKLPKKFDIYSSLSAKNDYNFKEI